jgi:hypothetical protein
MEAITKTTSSLAIGPRFEHVVLLSLSERRECSGRACGTTGISAPPGVLEAKYAINALGNAVRPHLAPQEQVRNLAGDLRGEQREDTRTCLAGQGCSHARQTPRLLRAPGGAQAAAKSCGRHICGGVAASLNKKDGLMLIIIRFVRATHAKGGYHVNR